MNLPSESIKALNQCRSPAFLIGNGIHRHQSNGDKFSWENIIREIESELCKKLKKADSIFPTSNIDDLNLTERYDLIQLAAESLVDKIWLRYVLNKKIVEILDEDRPKHIVNLAKFSREKDIPILTTNFDTAICNSNYLLKKFSKPFSDVYPWNSYYYYNNYEISESRHRIYHVHGFTQYQRSIRLGLNDYLLSVDRARRLLYTKDNNIPLTHAANEQWSGKETWLDIFLKSDLIIFGLGIKSTEIFLRWLLFQRKRIHSIKNQKYQLIYLATNNELLNPKRHFVEALDGTVIKLDSYTDIYQFQWINEVLKQSA